MKIFSLIAFTFVYLVSSQITGAQPVPAKALPGAIYTLDQGHSLLDFTARHMGFGRVRGTFNDYRASMYFVPGELESSSVTAVIDVSSLDTQDPGRDEHLREAFFEASKYPHLRFRSVRIEKKGEQYVMHGELTIKDVTKLVELPLVIITLDGIDQWQNQRIVLESSLTIDRRDYNVVYDNEFWNAIVSNEIKIDISFAASHYNARNTIFPWRKRSIGTLIRNGVAGEGLEATLAKVRALQNDTTHQYDTGINHFYRAGLALAQGGQVEEGVQVLQLAIDWHKDLAEAIDIADLHMAIAEIYAQEQRTDEAKEAVESALRIDPLNPSALELRRHL